MVTLRSKSAPRKSKRLQESSKIQKKKIENGNRKSKAVKKQNSSIKRRQKQLKDDFDIEEIKEEYETPPSSRRNSRSSSPIIIPHYGPVILKAVISRRNKRKPAFKPKNNDWISKSSKIEFIGPERRLFRANVLRRGHKKQRDYILVDYLYKNSYKTRLPPKNLWLDEPDYEFFPMQNVKGDNNNSEEPKKASKKPVARAKKQVNSEKTKTPAVRAKSASRAQKTTKEPKEKKAQAAKQRSKSVPRTPKKTSSQSLTSKTPSKTSLTPSIPRPKIPKRPRQRRDSSPELISREAFPSPPSESRSPTRRLGVPPPYHVPENPVYNLTSTPVNTDLAKPKPFRPWPMRARKPILAGSASPRSIHSGTSSLDIFRRNRRPSFPNQSQELEEINEDDDFDNEVMMLSPRRERVPSHQPRPTPHNSQHSLDRRHSFNSQPHPRGRVLSMPPPASSGSPSPSVNSSLGSASGVRRRPSKRWDDIFATKSPRKLQHSFSQPAISSSRSLHGDFMSRTANSQPLGMSTMIHPPATGNRSFSERQPINRRSLNDITLEDEDEMNDEADSFHIKRRSPTKKSKSLSNASIWDEAISQIKF